MLLFNNTSFLKFRACKIFKKKLTVQFSKRDSKDIKMLQNILISNTVNAVLLSVLLLKES